MIDESKFAVHPILILAGAGLVAGIGKLMASGEILSWRLVIGRALSSVTLGVTAGVGLTWLPDMSLTAMVGLASLVSSLGTSGLEGILQKFLGRK